LHNTPTQRNFCVDMESYGQETKIFISLEEYLAEYSAQVLPKLVEAGEMGALYCVSSNFRD
jgi:hypothetical protein